MPAELWGTRPKAVKQVLHLAHSQRLNLQYPWKSAPSRRRVPLCERAGNRQSAEPFLGEPQNSRYGLTPQPLGSGSGGRACPEPEGRAAVTHLPRAVTPPKAAAPAAAGVRVLVVLTEGCGDTACPPAWGELMCVCIFPCFLVASCMFYPFPNRSWETCSLSQAFSSCG